MRWTIFLFFFAVSVGASAQDSSRAQLLGKYKFPEGSVVGEATVSVENGVLMMNSSAGASSLELIKGDSFNVVSFNGTAVFKRNETKKVIGVHIDASGYVLDGVKDSTGNFTGSKIAGRLFPANETANESMADLLNNIKAKDLFLRRINDCSIE